MSTKQLINFNNEIFKVIYADEDEIEIQRTTEPKITVWGFHKQKEKQIKLFGWKNYVAYKIVKTFKSCT